MTDSLQTASSNGAGADIDAAETTRVARGRRCGGRARWARPGPADPRARGAARAARRQRPDREHHHAVREHDPARARGSLPGDPALERRLRSIVRWNAMAMVVRANKLSSELGGHIASFQSLATLYEVGYNHFWHAPSDGARGRSRVLPGSLLPRQLRPRVSGGAADRGAARRLPPGGLGRPAACRRIRIRG